MRHLDGPDRLAAGERLVNSGNTILISHRRPSELSIVSPELQMQRAKDDPDASVNTVASEWLQEKQGAHKTPATDSKAPSN